MLVDGTDVIMSSCTVLLIDSYPLELARPDADEAVLLVVNGIRSSCESNVTVNGDMRGDEGGD